MAILCPNTVSLSYLSSSFPLRKAYHLTPRSSSLSCPSWWKNTSTPADCRNYIGRGFLPQGCRATDSKKRSSVSGFEDQDAKVSEASVYEELEQKINNRLAGISGQLMAEMSCEREKEAQELYILEEETIADDKGRSPRDYYRRAHLFDKTAQIFTSLAEMSCEKEKEAQELYNLEEETIADDKGRSPRDYYRRAHLFDRTAQIFTSLVHKDDNNQEDATSEISKTI